MVFGEQFDDALSVVIQDLIDKMSLVFIYHNRNSVRTVPDFIRFYFRSVERLDTAVFVDITCECYGRDFIDETIVVFWLSWHFLQSNGAFGSGRRIDRHLHQGQKCEA